MHRQDVRDRNEELRAESVRLIDRCRRAVTRATGLTSASSTTRSWRDAGVAAVSSDGVAGGPDFWFDLVPIVDLFQIWVDHFGLSVLDAVETLAVQLVLSGYSTDADEVAAADAIAMTHRVSVGPG